jgi:D-3-phosphoglycerate dehydrogenase
MKKIFISTSNFDLSNFEDLDLLKNNNFEIILNQYKRRLNEVEIKSVLSEDSIIGLIAGLEPLNENVLSTAKSLKVISRCGIGLDNIDLNYTEINNIKVFNTPDSPTTPVAELTLAHILNLLRGVSIANANIRSNKWGSISGNLLEGKNVGIIGYGRIGRKVAKLIKAFGANIFIYDINKLELDESISQVSLEDLLTYCDIVSLHLPYTEQSHHMISQKELSLMKKSSIILNLSRGGLINENDLYNALITNQISGAGIDAFETEPYSGKLLNLQNVLLTCHMGSNAYEARIKMERESIKNLVNELKELNLLKYK